MKRDGNINFVLVGARATGKTAYLTALYSQINEVTADDSQTIDYLKPFADKLGEGVYPSATSGGLKELFFNYKDNEFTASIQIDDVDGYFIETLSQKNEETEKERNDFMRNLKLSEGIIFFFPYQKQFNQETIKDFNYQIDFIISKLKSFYPNKDAIPIPSVIAISKWDNSPDFKSKDEIEKGISYIEKNEFLRLAKNKIELNFSNVELMPISAIGKDISSIEPYNLLNPLRFFLEKTYENWVEKIESFNDNQEELFIFLSKINFDIKFYENGKYSKLYEKLEKEYSNKLIPKAKESKDIKEFNKFKKEKKKLINALTPQKREELENIEKVLKKKKRGKRGKNIFIGVFILITLAFLAYLNKDNRNEEKLYNDILTSYKTHNYNEALSDISSYMKKYENKGIVEHIKKIKEIEYKIKKERRINEAKKILEDEIFDDSDKIEVLLNDFDKLGIEQPEIRKALKSKKESISANISYSDFVYDLKNSIFIEAINYTEQNWNTKFSKEAMSQTRRVLDNKFNKKVEELLKNISSIRDIDELKNQGTMIKKIESLKKNSIQKISYTPLLSIENKSELEKNRQEFKKYNSFIKGGILNPIISFKTKGGEANDELLGFECDGEDDIILRINSTVYHFDKRDSCLKDGDISTMTWKNIKNILKVNRKNDVKVIEEDITKDDEYKKNFTLKKNDLINIYNGYKISKYIGHSYFIEIQRNQ